MLQKDLQRLKKEALKKNKKERAKITLPKDKSKRKMSSNDMLLEIRYGSG